VLDFKGMREYRITFFFNERYHIVTQAKIGEISQPPDRAKFYCACQFI
jgi:hypothetical protein